MNIRVRSVVLGLLALLVVALGGLITAVGWEVVLGPKARPVTDRAFEVTDERLARGRYLVEGVAACLHCHTEHDFSDPAYPILQDRKGAGWDMPIPELGRVVAPNITSDPETGLGAWTDDEIARAIREGVSRDGSALFPVMPYMDFAAMDDEDVAAVVVYLRTLPPVRSALPRSQLIFPLNRIVNTMPQPLDSPPPPRPTGPAAARGQYLVTLGSCQGCHTPVDDRGVPRPELAFSGGGAFKDPGQDMREMFSLNITPDPSGIAHYDEAFFINTMRSGQLSSRMLNHIMPFEFFRHITDDDVRDIWAFLGTVRPVRHRVSNTDPPAPCAVCGQAHGLGELNEPAGAPRRR